MARQAAGWLGRRAGVIRARLKPAGRIVMNALVMNDIDPAPDRITARLAGDALPIWIVDEPGIQDRDAIVVCVPERQLNARPELFEVMASNLRALVDPARPRSGRWCARRLKARARDGQSTSPRFCLR